MSSAAIAVQEQHESPTSDQILLKSNTTDKGVQPKEQFNSMDDSSLKVRKPYTITKQRERWTDEEHTKFLEALKLYGRAWKKIEEHVGTKTAVQIRSHAQKFFSKVVRESNNGDASAAKPIEIPPARPKRKPMHPYPRKLVSQAKTGISIHEKLTRSESQDSSTSEQENQSPVSVLSAISSDTSVRADSCTPNGSLSPVSSTLALNACTESGSEAPKMMMMSHDARSQPGNEDENPNPDEGVPLKLELLSGNNDDVLEDQSGVRCLKLFGKTLLVKDYSGTSYLTLGTCEPYCSDKTEESCSPPARVIPANPSGDACSPVPLQLLTLCVDASLSTQDIHSPIPIKVQLHMKKETLDSYEQNEVSSSGSNTDSARDRSWDVDSLPYLVEKKGNAEKSFSFSRLSKRLLDNSEDCRRGFVPYKRRPSEKNFSSS